MQETFRGNKIAVVMLACRDYEATELALACHMAYGNRDVPFYILQNCRGNYDAERTLEVARRYEQLFPRTVKVVDWLPPGPPYHSISRLLQSDEFARYDLICKVDDDAFPIAPGWLNELVGCFLSEEEARGERLAYVTPLINNNCWGFLETIKAMGLADEYFSSVAMEHRIGAGAESAPYRILPASEVGTGANGTVWGYPHIARWLHERTTLQPDAFIEATRSLGSIPVPSKERYSIGCLVFRRTLWEKVEDGGTDDEHMLHQYCAKRDRDIVCQASIPFVHLAYFSQREENRDLVERAREVYEPRLKFPFPIALRSSRLLEIEARLRWMENASGTAGGASAGVSGALSPEVFGVQAAKGVAKAILFKLKLRKTPPR